MGGPFSSMDLKKLYIEHAIYPAMTLLQAQPGLRLPCGPEFRRADRGRPRLHVPGGAPPCNGGKQLRGAAGSPDLGPAAPGQPGLVACLIGKTMPHLRVVLDYMARWDETPCPCGRTLPVLEDLQRMALSE